MDANSRQSGPVGRLLRWALPFACAFIYLFLIVPIVVIVPLSFNAEPYFTFTKGMLALDPSAYSTRWYREVWDNAQWLTSIQNSFLIGLTSAAAATLLGTPAAMALAKPGQPFQRSLTAFILAPAIIPVIISGAGMYFFYSSIGLSQTFAGLILSHTALGVPFVVMTVTATLANFDHSLIRASANLGASPFRTFRSITLPLIMPGVLSGAVLAFITSFDEVVVALFLSGTGQRTLPRQMWAGMRESFNPTILAVATLLTAFTILLLLIMHILLRRKEVD